MMKMKYTKSATNEYFHLRLRLEKKLIVIKHFACVKEIVRNNTLRFACVKTIFVGKLVYSIVLHYNEKFASLMIGNVISQSFEQLANRSHFR